MASRIQHFCAFCSLPYRSYKQKHVGWKEVLLATAFSMPLMWMLWQRVHVLGFLMWASVLLFSEVLLRIRWRASIQCGHCGFDPILYKTSPARAAETVKGFLEKRKSDPHYLLKPQPLLPVRRVPRKADTQPPAAEM